MPPSAERVRQSCLQSIIKVISNILSIAVWIYLVPQPTSDSPWKQMDQWRLDFIFLLKWQNVAIWAIVLFLKQAVVCFVNSKPSVYSCLKATAWYQQCLGALRKHLGWDTAAWEKLQPNRNLLIAQQPEAAPKARAAAVRTSTARMDSLWGMRPWGQWREPGQKLDFRRMCLGDGELRG